MDPLDIQKMLIAVDRQKITLLQKQIEPTQHNRIAENCHSSFNSLELSISTKNKYL